MSLPSSLSALGAVLEPPEALHGDPEYPVPKLCPRLRTTYSPRTSWWAHREASECRGGRPSWSRIWEPAEPADMGFSLVPNSKRPTRYGLNGFPPAGRRSVWRALCLLEADRVNLGFWTITLPGEALDQLAASGNWKVFQDRIRKELARRLEAAGIQPLVVGVVELQPKRTRDECRPCPHLHIVYRARRHRGAPYAISADPSHVAGGDRIILAALLSAGVVPPEGVEPVAWLAKAGKIESIRKSVRAYLSRYMTKEQGSPGLFYNTPLDTLIPHQWWFWTKTLRLMVEAHIFPLDPSFIFWVHIYRAPLIEKGMIAHREINIPDSKAPRTWEINWISPEHMAAVVTAWQLDTWDIDWHRKHGLTQWLP